MAKYFQELIINCYGKITYFTDIERLNKMTFAPSEDSDQPGHPPSLIRVFAVRFMGS